MVPDNSQSSLTPSFMLETYRSTLKPHTIVNSRLLDVGGQPAMEQDLLQLPDKNGLEERIHLVALQGIDGSAIVGVRSNIGAEETMVSLMDAVINRLQILPIQTVALAQPTSTLTPTTSPTPTTFQRLQQPTLHSRRIRQRPINRPQPQWLPAPSPRLSQPPLPLR